MNPDCISKLKWGQKLYATDEAEVQLGIPTGTIAIYLKREGIITIKLIKKPNSEPQCYNIKLWDTSRTKYD
jgi:hypothetical protein